MYQNTSELEIALLEYERQFQGNFGNKEKKATLYKALKDLLQNELGGSYKISKGFILCGTQDNLSPLIDMIIYQNSEIYNNDKFVIVESRQIKAVFTLISSFKPSNFYSLITNLCKIKANVGRNIFTGIISYPCENGLSDDDFKEIKDRFEQKLQSAFDKNGAFVDCVSFSKIWFMRKEYRDEPNMDYLDTTSYDFYNLNLPYVNGVSSYKYLIGNLRMHLNLNTNGYFLHPENKQEANQIKIVLKRTLNVNQTIKEIKWKH